MATGTYAFNTAYYSLTIMPFQKIMDQILFNIRNTFAFIDDILFVTKVTKEQHIAKVKEVLKFLDEAGIRLKLEKSKFAQEKTEWLGYKLSESRVKPINEKIQAIPDRLRPKNLRKLHTLMVALNQMNRFIPNLAKLCAPLRPLRSKTNEWKWTDEHEKTYQTKKNEIQNFTKKTFRKEPTS